MTECTVIRDLLPLYADDTVSEETKAIIKEHLEECPACRDYYEHVRSITHALQEDEAPGAYHYSGVVSRIRRRELIGYSVDALLFAAAVFSAAKLIFGGRRDR